MSPFFRRYLLVASLLAFPAGVALAGPPSLWTGVVKAGNGKSARVLATIDGERVSLRFGEPANCSIVARLLDTADGTTIYRFSMPQNGGGFCSRLYPGDLSIASVEDGSLDLVFHRQKMPWSGLLHRVVDP